MQMKPIEDDRNQMTKTFPHAVTETKAVLCCFGGECHKIWLKWLQIVLKIIIDVGDL